MSVVSQEFDYQVESEGLASRNYRTILPSESSEYGLGSRILINIPHVHNGVLNCSESFLNLSMTVSALTGTGVADNATDIRLSSIGIYSAIDEINVISGSGYVQHCINHQQIVSMLLVANSNTASNLPNSVTCGIPPVDVANKRINPASTVAGSAIAKKNYSIPLIALFSSIKHLPIFAINDSITLELVMCQDIRNIFYSSENDTFITGGTCTFTAEYDAALIVVNDNAIREIRQASGLSSDGILSWSDTQFHAVNSTVTVDELNVPAKTYKQQLIGGVKSRQLLQLFHFGTRQTLGSGDMFECLNYWEGDIRWRIGSEHYPPRYISGMAENKAHLNECFNQNAVSLYNSCGDNSNAGLSQRAVAVDVAKTKTQQGVGGYNFTKYVDTASGIDTMDKQILSEVSLKINGTVTVPLNAVTVKRIGVIYSISGDGEFTVSY